MHTTRVLSPATFAVTVDGVPGDLDAALPGFDAHDRLGVVVRRPLGGAGASLLVLAAVTAFYAASRRQGELGTIYPDYFVFHAGEPFGDHRKLEIWPPHKEVVVEAGTEPLLRAINDRAVTRLVVEDGDPAAAQDGLAPETLASARRRIASCLAYAPSGRVPGGRIAIAGDDATERFLAAMLADSGAAADAAPERRDLLADGRPVETYRAVGLDEALALL